MTALMENPEIIIYLLVGVALLFLFGGGLFLGPAALALAGVVRCVREVGWRSSLTHTHALDYGKSELPFLVI